MFTMRSKKVVLVLFLPTLTLLFYWSSEMISKHIVSGGQLANLQQTVSVQARGTEETVRESTLSPVEERQTARKHHLKDYCLRHRFNKIPTKTQLKFIVVDDKHKIMFCTIPKVASTTWKRVLADLSGLRQGIFVHRPGLWRRLNEYEEKEKSIRLKTYFKFVFVREPLHRLLSAFKDKFIGKNRNFSKNIRKVIVKAFRPKDFDPNGDNNITFAEFVEFYSRDTISRNPHWRQYGDLCHPCVINYDFIGHLETMKEDATLLLKMAGIEDRIKFPPIHNSTSSREIITYYSTVPSEYVSRLAEQYRNDFDLFGYEYLGPVKQLLNQSSTGTV